MASVAGTAILISCPGQRARSNLHAQANDNTLPTETLLSDNSAERDSASRCDDELGDLMVAIVARDQAALAQLYDVSVDRIYRLAYALTGNAADAEEVVGDVYLQAWQRAERYDAGRGPVIAWLLIICRSLSLDLLRRRRAQLAGREKLAQQVPPPDPPPTAADLLNLLQQSSSVHRALRELPELQGQMISLAFLRDMSHSEIAAAVRLPLGTVKSHIRRGLKSLRKAIECDI